MATIKKAYADIVSYLQDNADAAVADVLPTVVEMASAKSGGGGGKPSTFHRDEEGNVVGIFCYYHKLWMNPADVEFGQKASSATGFNNMCKDGVSKWTKQQRGAKAAKEQLLAQVSAGEVAPEDIADEMARIEEEASVIVPREDGYGFATLEELLEA